MVFIRGTQEESEAEENVMEDRSKKIRVMYFEDRSSSHCPAIQMVTRGETYKETDSPLGTLRKN